MNGQRGGMLLRILLLLVLLALIAGAAAVWHDYSRFTKAPLDLATASRTLVIKPGSSFRQIIQQVHYQGLSRAPFLYWRVLARRMDVTESLDAGEYRLRRGTSPRQLLQMLAAGKVMQHSFTIVEGWSFEELRAALDGNDVLRHVTADLSAAAIMQRLGEPGMDPEGRFLPQTYLFPRGYTDLQLLRRAREAMRKTLAKAWEERAEGLSLDSPYEALILASIVEKETARADERKRIAGVFERRLKRGIALATDPTVIYGLGDSYHGNITRRDLETDTPYNTYMNAGLTPTPIAMPGKAAIVAVLHPAEGDALYFVARDDGTGRHKFSATLAEHNRAVACFQLHRCRQ